MINPITYLTTRHDMKLLSNKCLKDRSFLTTAVLILIGAKKKTIAVLSSNSAKLLKLQKFG